MTIKEAMELLRKVIPARERTIGISAELMDYDHYELDDPGRLAVRFRVWDGRDGYTGHTLDIAVHKTLLANAPGQGKVEEAEPFMAEMEALGVNTALSETDTGLEGAAPER